MMGIVIPDHAMLHAEIDGWEILTDFDDDGDCRKTSWWASRGEDKRRIDVSPYREPSLEVLVAFVALDFSGRATFGSIGPIAPEQILARYWRQRALEAEERIRALVA